MKCNLCQYEWDNRNNIPKCCPRCKRYDYLKKEVEKNGSKRDRPDNV